MIKKSLKKGGNVWKKEGGKRLNKKGGKKVKVIQLTCECKSNK
jgi:hypothetical protein